MKNWYLYFLRLIARVAKTAGLGLARVGLLKYWRMAL